MGLTKRSDSDIVYLQAKHFCLWREIKNAVEGCETVQVNNPKTGATVTKHGFKYDTVEGHVVKLEKYDREYSGTRFFGFKLHIQDGPARFVLDMPYQSQILRRFLRTAPNVDWDEPLAITVFKSKPTTGAKNADGMIGVWFQQHGETVKPYFTRDQPHGMPNATQDPDTHEWDFKTQHRWLVDRLKSETVLDIETAARRTAPPDEPQGEDSHSTSETFDSEAVNHPGITDDDVPF